MFFPLRKLEQPIYTRQLETGKDIYGKRQFVDLILYYPPIVACLPRGSVQVAGVDGERGSEVPVRGLEHSAGRVRHDHSLDGGGYAPGAKQWLVTKPGRTEASCRSVLYVIPQI